MTHETLMHTVLIAISKGFGFVKLFERKIDSLFEQIELSHVTLLGDKFNIVTPFFSDRGIKIENIPVMPRGFEKKIKKFSHVVIFWDGEDLLPLVFEAMLQKLQLRIVPVKITKVRNKDKDDEFDIYIGRGTPWGNPFPIGIGGKGETREQVIEKFFEYFETEFLQNPEKHKALLSLRGYRLGCHCKPLACHGDVLAAYLNSYEDPDALDQS